MLGHNRKFFIVAAALVVAVLLGSVVAGPTWPEERGINNKQAITAAWDAPLFSVNTETTSGNATANAVITSMTNSGFWYYNKDLEFVRDESFGHFELEKQDPLTVSYTLADHNVWSDGVPVTAADMLLEWAATSGRFNTLDPSDLDKDAEGNLVDAAGNKVDTGTQVVFNASNPGRATITQTPVISNGNKTIEFTYSTPRADWASLFNGPAVPAHIVAEKALGISDPTVATAALVSAIQDDDRQALAKIADFWNTGFDFTSMPTDRDVLVSNGAYTITSYVQNQFLSLARSHTYNGDRNSAMNTITVRYITDPMAEVTALRNGEVDLIGPQATADVRQAVEALHGVTVRLGTESTYEHVTLNMLAGGVFSPSNYGGDAERARLVRQAFLLSIPRQRIVDNLIKPLNPTAQVRNSLLIIPGAPGYEEMVEANGSLDYPTTGDTERARQLLEQAGIKGPVRVRFSFNGDNARRGNQFVLIRENAARAGFDVVDASLPAAAFSQSLSGGRDSWDATLFAWASTSTAVTGTDTTYRTGGSNNHGSYSNPTVDALFNALAEETNPQTQLEIQKQIEQQLWHDGVSIPIFQFPAIAAWSDHFTGINPSTLSPFIFAGFWKWDEAAS